MRNTFEFHSNLSALSIPCDPPRKGDLSEVAQDMSKLWGGAFQTGVVRMENLGNGKFPVYGQRMRNQEGNIIVTYEPGALVTDLEIKNLNVPLQSTRCAAALLYMQKLDVFLDVVPISFYGSNPEEEKGLLRLLNENGEESRGLPAVSLPNLLLLTAGSDDVFGGDEGSAAMAEVVGATDFDTFHNVWIDAEREPTPLAAAQLLLARRAEYYRPESL